MLFQKCSILIENPESENPHKQQTKKKKIKKLLRYFNSRFQNVRFCWKTEIKIDELNVKHRNVWNRHTICIWMHSRSLDAVLLCFTTLGQILCFPMWTNCILSHTNCLVLNWYSEFIIREKKTNTVAEAHTHVSESTRFCRLSKNHMNSLFSPFVRSTFTHTY